MNQAPPVAAFPVVTQAYHDLLGNFNLNDPTRVYFYQQGFVELEILCELSEEKISKFITQVNKAGDDLRKEMLQAQAVPGDKIEVGFVAQERIKCLRFWFQQRKRCGLGVEPGDFNADEGVRASQRMKEEEAIKDASSLSNPIKPKELKDLAKYRVFYDQWTAYTAQIRGAAHIPINYVFRDDADTAARLQEAAWSDVDDELHYKTQLQGDHYVADNKRVFLEFKELIQNGPGWEFIKRFNRSKNGREAVLALKSQSEGLAGKNTRRNAAKAIFEMSNYQGQRKNFTIDNYIEKFQFAINEMEDIGEPVAEAAIVTDFLRGVKDPRLEAARTFVMGSGTHSNSWQQTQQYFKTVVVALGQHIKPERGVSAVEKTSEVMSTTQGGNRKDKKKGSNKPKEITARTYSSKEWNALSDNDKKKVADLRAARKAKRTLKVVETSDSPVEESNKENETRECKALEVEASAGLQFGRRVHFKIPRKNPEKDPVGSS